ncbi:MAG TPA: hypothetical protein PLT82_12715 [Candidatus Hydrogenedens sp.]|nr:hypothetical protein [Candidatus Hydrogenedens sp.]HOK08856.1 hypothetical protein [Candidatus Hydrogenedens sp.]HOL21167.1 hypothetical protein [Candidatus Hydrogenedens sp.]HPP59984.1 hypothetical protein [Candidatus Hydrogenedens sp.]
MRTYPTIPPERLETTGGFLYTIVNQFVEIVNHIFKALGWWIRVIPWE